MVSIQEPSYLHSPRSDSKKFWATITATMFFGLDLPLNTDTHSLEEGKVKGNKVMYHVPNLIERVQRI